MPNKAMTHLRDIGKSGTYDKRRYIDTKNTYNNAAWRRTRERILRRASYYCAICEEYAGKSAHCDHVIPKLQGGDDSDKNLQCLCPTCHSIKTLKEGRHGF